jgi:hypothetical protein
MPPLLFSIAKLDGLSPFRIHDVAAALGDLKLGAVVHRGGSSERGIQVFFKELAVPPAAMEEVHIDAVLWRAGDSAFGAKVFAGMLKFRKRSTRLDDGVRDYILELSRRQDLLLFRLLAYLLGGLSIFALAVTLLAQEWMTPVYSAEGIVQTP